MVKTSRREAVLAVLFALILGWINTYIVRDTFFGVSAHMNSMHGFWTAIAARAGSSWFRATWWPFWEMGVPFEYTYSPLVPGLAALIGWVRRCPPGMAYQSVTGLIYILGPLTMFFAAWRLTRRPGASFAAGLLYSLTSVTQVLAPDGVLEAKNFWDARRLYVMTVWDDTPHMAALAFLPLVILFLARSIETRRPIYYAATAVSIAATGLASAFGPVAVVMAAICLLAVLGPENWRGNALLTAGLGAWGWAIAAPFLSPSFMGAIREANAAQEGAWNLQSLTALTFTILGWSILWHYLPRFTTDWRIRFFVLFAWVVSSIPLADLIMHSHFLPQPGRYKLEMELALPLAAVFAAGLLANRIPRAIRIALVLYLLALAAQQVSNFRKAEKADTFPREITTTIEYRAAIWAQQNYPNLRFFMPGSIAQWTNTFTGVQQFTGESFTMAVNQVQQRADTMIAFGTDDVAAEVRMSLAWLKAYGVGVIAVTSKESEEFWKAFTHPQKFDGVLPVLWSQGGVTMYRVPLREFTLAHVVPESALVKRQPLQPDDTAEVERFAAALDDASLPGTSFDWEGRNRIRIRSTVVPGQVLTIQEGYHPGWHASVSGKSTPVHRDGLGLMWLRPDCHGNCEVTLDYDGGWELRVCRWLSWLALAGLVGALVLDRRVSRR
ncbi:MAG TPA: hypothetical protein VML19_09525 [Verrucomicrobiae bacterium]|nr:hypothetical protein [Verrucomicrobiae bacterium]